MGKIAWWLGIFVVLCIGGALIVRGDVVKSFLDAFLPNYRIGSPVISPIDDQRDNESISTSTIGDDSRYRTLSSDVPKKYVSLVIVRDEVRSQYDGNTWTQNIGFTE